MIQMTMKKILKDSVNKTVYLLKKSVNESVMDLGMDK